MEFYARLAREYGGFSRFFYGRKPTFLAASPDAIKELLVDKREIYVKNTRYAAIRRAIGNGLLSSEGETLEEAAPAHSERAQPQGDSRAGSRRLGRRRAEARRMASGRRARHAGQHRARPDRHGPGPDRPVGARHSVRSPRRRGHRAGRGRAPGLAGSRRARYGRRSSRRRYCKLRKLERLLAKARPAIYAAIRGQRESGSVDFSLLSGLARAGVEEGEGFSDQELRDQLLTLYHAGFETSASNLTFLFYELSSPPGDPQAPAGGGRSRSSATGCPKGDDLADLEYTRCCLSETLRLYPPAYNFTRVSLEEHTLSGYPVPKGSMVIVSPYATHRMEELFPDPLRFDPDRFRPEASEGRSQFAYIPFGAGHRFCVGQGLAEVQTKVIASMISQRFELDCVSDRPVETQPGTVMRPDGRHDDAHPLRPRTTRRQRARSTREDRPVLHPATGLGLHLRAGGRGLRRGVVPAPGARPAARHHLSVGHGAHRARGRGAGRGREPDHPPGRKRGRRRQQRRSGHLELARGH